MRPVYSFSITALFISLLLLPVGAIAQVMPAGVDQPSDFYRIQRGDKLSIKFFANADLNETDLIVRPDGFISPQIIKEIRAAGRTVSELKIELERQYNETLLDPLITVSVVEFVAPRIFVGGQINKPGRYDLREARTLIQAIFLAGGFTSDAKRSMVIHARPDQKGDWVIKTANVMNILNQKGANKDLALADGDYIFVPDSKISQINKAVEAFRGLLPRFF